MGWWSTLVGGALGFVIGGPIGALLGAVLGNALGGNTVAPWAAGRRGDPQRIQTVFFTTVFSVMGHLAKADGRVSEDEIRIARTIMKHMRLNAQQVDTAIRLFNQGKRPDFPLDAVLRQFRAECRGRDLLLAFLEIQVQAALADKQINSAEHAMLAHMCDVLGIARGELDRLIALIRAQRGETSARTGALVSLAQAYQVLGISKNASNADVKKAYRRLMSQHHPDKLVAKGLPEEMVQMAAEKTRQLNVAYDAIKEARGMK